MKDECHDNDILSYLNRPISAILQRGNSSRIRKLKPASQTQTNTKLADIIKKLNDSNLHTKKPNVTTKRCATAFNTEITDQQKPTPSMDNIYYFFANQRTQTTDTNSQLQQTTNISRQRMQNDLSQPQIAFNKTLTTQSSTQARIMSRIKTQDCDMSIYKSFNFDNQDKEQKLIQKSFINDMIIQRPVSQKDNGQNQKNNKKFQLLRSKTKSPQDIAPLDESSKKMQRIKEFDLKRKNILGNCQKIKKIGRGIYIYIYIIKQLEFIIQNQNIRLPNDHIISRPTQELEKNINSTPNAGIDKKSEKTILPTSEKKEVQVTQVTEINIAVAKIQKFYRKRRDALLLIHKNKSKEYQRQILLLQSNKRSSFTILTSDSDSLKDIQEMQEEAEDNSPKKKYFQRSNTMLNEENQKFLIKGENQQHQILHQKIPQIQIHTDKFKRSQNARNSVKLIIQSAKNQNYLQLPSQKRASYISSQRRNIKEESDDSFHQFHQPLFGSVKNIKADGLDTQYFILMSFYMHFQNQGNCLWKIHAIESSVLFSPVQSECSDTSRTHRPMYIQLVISFETHFFKGPLVWKINYDKKLYKSRKNKTIYEFADSILRQYMTENLLNSFFLEVIEERKEKQRFQQQQDDNIQSFMEKIYFLLARHSLQQFQMNGKTLKVCDQALEVPIIKRQIDRWQQMQQRYRELRASQRAFNIQVPYMILMSHIIDVKQNDTQIQQIISQKASLKFKKVKNTILFAVRSGGLKNQPIKSSPQITPRLQEITIPLLRLGHQVTLPDIGAIVPNKSLGQFEEDSIILSSKRDKDVQDQKIKKISHLGTGSKRMSSNLDQHMNRNDSQINILKLRKGSQRDHAQVSFKDIPIQKHDNFLEVRNNVDIILHEPTIQDEQEKQFRQLFHKTQSFYPNEMFQTKKDMRTSINLSNIMEVSQVKTKVDRQHIFKSVQVNQKQKRSSQSAFRSSLTVTEPYQKLHQSEKNSETNIEDIDESPNDKKGMINSINSFKEDLLLEFVNRSSIPSKTQDRPKYLEHQFTINEEESVRNIPIKQKLNSFKQSVRLEDFDQIMQDENYIIFKREFFSVSPLWRTHRKKIIHKLDKYFDQPVLPRHKNNYCYLNPFPNKSLILVVFLKKDGTLFQIQVSLQYLKEIEQFTTQMTQSKDIKIQINFISFDRKHGNKSSKENQSNYWQDEVTVYFKDFIKWFVGDYKLYEFISKQVLKQIICKGFTQSQKINIISNINQNINIQDCKLKIEYYKDNGQKKLKRKYERKDLHIEQIMILESFFKREVGSAKFQEFIDLFINNDEKYLIPYYKILQDQRIKVAQTERRKQNRVKLRTIKQTALTSAVEFIGHNIEIGPVIVIEQNETFIHSVIREAGRGVPLLNYELAKDMLQSYNTLRILKGEKYIFPYRNIKGHYTYLIWKSLPLAKAGQEKLRVRLICPFSKHSADLFVISRKNKEKLINLSQIEGQYKNKQSSYQISSLKNFMLNNSFRKVLSLTGFSNVMHTLTHPQQSFKKIDQIILKHVMNDRNCTLDDLYQLQSLFKVSLLAASKNDGSIWNVYFQQTQRLMYGKLKNFGPCFMDITVFVDIFHFSLQQGIQRQIFVKVNVFKKDNMRTLACKIVLGQQDLVLLFNKEELSFQIDTQLPVKFIDNLYTVICKLFVFEKDGIYMAPKIHIKGHRSRHTVLQCKFPWIQNYLYSDQSSQPYQAQNNFYNQVTQNPLVICHISTFIKLPYNSRLPNSGQYADQTIMPNEIIDGDSPIQIPCIFTITFSKFLKSYFIHMYFQKTCRKFVTQISFLEVRVRKENPQLDDWVREQCGLQNRQQLFDLLSQGKGQTNVQLWLALSRTFHIFINEHNKTLLHIPIFQITCVFQEVLYHEVRKLAKDNEEALFQILVEQSKHKIPGQLPSLNKPLRKIRIIESNYFNVFIKISWLQHQEKKQSSKIPLSQILMGYYKKYGNIFGRNDQNVSQESVYNYVFIHSDLIRMAKIVCEMIILNWQSTRMDLFEILPLENFPKQKQSIKTNASITLSMAFAHSLDLLMYTGILIKRPQTMMTLFLRRDKNQVCFYIQRLSDCQICKKSVEFDQIENNLPGFKAQIQGSNHELGRKLFLLFKNRMILHSYYKLKD